MRIWGWRMMMRVSHQAQYRYRFNVRSVMRSSAVLALAGMMLLPSATKSQGMVEAQTNSALSAFYGFCLNSGFVAKDVSVLAERFGWKKVPGSEMDIYTPKTEANYLFYDGYIILTPDDPPLPTLAFAGERFDEGEKVEYCSLFFQDVLSEKFVDGLKGDAPANKISDQKIIGQRNRFYEIADFPRGIVLIESEVRSERGLRASFIHRAGSKK